MARHQPEADFLVNLLHEGGVPAFHRRGAGFDVPDFLALGPRDIMVPADQLDAARRLLDPADWHDAPGASPPAL